VNGLKSAFLDAEASLMPVQAAKDVDLCVGGSDQMRGRSGMIFS